MAMTIPGYLSEVGEAVDHLFASLRADTEEIDRLTQQLGMHEHEATEWHKAALTIGGPFGDDADPERDWARAVAHYRAAEDAEKNIHDRIAARAMSRGALAGALLQIAKQGLSLVYGAKGSVPPGRPVGGQPLREVIWEGRNHGMHWEEGNPRPDGVTCFNALNADFADRVRDYLTTNVSVEILGILGWTDFNSFASDLQTF